MCAVHGPWRKKEEILPLLTEEDKEKEGTNEPQDFDLKPLPVELKYAYLEENNRCPIVISSLLNGSQESSLLEVLRKNKQAIGWKISDLKGIIPLVSFSLYPSYLFGRRGQTSEIATEETKSSYAGSGTCKVS